MKHGMCLKKMGFVSSCSIIYYLFSMMKWSIPMMPMILYTHPMVAFYSFLLECIWSWFILVWFFLPPLIALRKKLTLFSLPIKQFAWNFIYITSRFHLDSHWRGCRRIETWECEWSFLCPFCWLCICNRFGIDWSLCNQL